MMFHFGLWDYLLIGVVSIQSTLAAYLYQPRHKALMLVLPIPFTFATLSLGRPVDASNVLGLVLLLLFTHGVRWLHYGRRLPILPSIVLAALGYCLLGMALTPLLPAGDTAFALASAFVLALGLVLFLTDSGRAEPGHRSPLPLYLKLPLIVAVIVGLVLLKKSLHGFMTVFPMVGVVTAYEARKSLWTSCRYIPVNMLTLLPLFVVSRLSEPRLGLWPSLLAGWVVYFAVLFPLLRAMRQRTAENSNI